MTFKSTAKCILLGEFGNSFEVVLDSVPVRLRISMLCLFVSNNLLRNHKVPYVLAVFLAPQRQQQTLQRICWDFGNPLEKISQGFSFLFGIFVQYLLAILCFARTAGLPYVLSVFLASQNRQQAEQCMFSGQFGRPVEMVLGR